MECLARTRGRRLRGGRRRRWTALLTCRRGRRIRQFASCRRVATDSMNSPTPIAAGVACAVLCFLAGCGPSQREVLVERAREVRCPIRGLDASSAERFGSMGAGRSESVGGQEAIPLEVDLPDGWTRLPPAQYRDLNFAGPDGLSAWVSILSPQAGELAHVNRWRGQVGLGPTDAAAIEAPRLRSRRCARNFPRPSPTASRARSSRVSPRR